MITDSLIEDNILIRNLANESGLALDENIRRVVERLNFLLRYDNTDIILSEIKKFTDTVSNFISKLKDIEKPLEKMLLIRNILPTVRYFNKNRLDYVKPITGVIEQELINEVFTRTLSLEKVLIDSEVLQIIRAYLEAITSTDSGLIWCKNLYSTIFYLLEILEDDNAHLIPKNILRIIETNSEKLSENEFLKEYIKTPKNDENKEQIRNYVNGIRHAVKAILWELKKIRKNQPNVKSILNFIDSSPTWKGDDFQECLDFINERRRV